MRAVNLIPADSRGGAAAAVPSTGMQVPVYVLLGFLAAAVALVTVYVLTEQLDHLAHGHAHQPQDAGRPGAGGGQPPRRVLEVRPARPDAHQHRQLDRGGAVRLAHRAGRTSRRSSRPNTTLQSIVGTVVPGASAGGGASTGSLRADITAPAFELTGCTANQDDVARLMSRLRLINGVTRVSFSNSQESNSPTASAGASGGSGAQTAACAERPELRPDRLLHARGERRAPTASPRSAAALPPYQHHRRDPVTARDRIVIMVVLALGASRGRLVLRGVAQALAGVEPQQPDLERAVTAQLGRPAARWPPG